MSMMNSEHDRQLSFAKTRVAKSDSPDLHGEPIDDPLVRGTNDKYAEEFTIPCDHQIEGSQSRTQQGRPLNSPLMEARYEPPYFEEDASSTMAESSASFPTSRLRALMGFALGNPALRLEGSHRRDSTSY